jgi:Holliday junction resolvase RusA-like endonuclease
MTGAITFTVPGEPSPWKRAGSNGAQRFTLDSMAGHKETVRWCAHAAGVRPVDCPVRLDVVAIFATPRSWSVNRRLAAIGCPVAKTPDGDNLVKLIADALEGIAYPNDKQVALGLTAKIWGGTPRTVITVTPIPADLPLMGLPGMPEHAS